MPNWMAFNIDDYVSNTLHLTTRQHGAYILLICAAWKGRGALPGTDVGLMAITKLSLKQWAQDGATLKAFLTRRGDEWVHERVLFEWTDAQELIGVKSRAGKSGARKRWEGRAHGTPNGSSPILPLASAWQDHAPLPLPVQIPKKESDYSLPVTSTESGTTGRGAHSQKRMRRAPAAGRTDLFTPKPKEPAHAQGRRLAEDWQPTPAERDFAADLGLDPQATSEHFADYWHQTAGARGRKVDWTATWRIWCRREVQDRRPGGPARPGAVRPARGGGLTSAFVDLAAHLEAKRRGGA